MEWLSLLLIIAVLTVGLFILKTILGRQQEDKPWPYRAKKYFFSRSEQEFLGVLNESIDRQRYLIFPKVRLADFIEVTIRGEEYQGWWNKIRSKHVDFLIWDVQQNKIALAIELDGKSHSSEKAQERDDFVNRLYERVEAPLERVLVGSNFLAEVDRISNTLKV